MKEPKTLRQLLSELPSVFLDAEVDGCFLFFGRFDEPVRGGAVGISDDDMFAIMDRLVHNRGTMLSMPASRLETKH